MKDMFYPTAPVPSVNPEASTTSIDGETVDLQGYEGALVLAAMGVAGITLSGSNKIEFEVEESDDDSTWTDVADDDLVGHVDGTNDGCFGVVDTDTDDESVVFSAAYVGAKRYIRVVANFIGTHGTASPVSASVIRGHGRHQNVV